MKLPFRSPRLFSSKATFQPFWHKKEEMTSGNETGEHLNFHRHKNFKKSKFSLQQHVVEVEKRNFGPEINLGFGMAFGMGSFSKLRN